VSNAIDFSNRHFLVVDDQLVIRSLVVGILRSFGQPRVQDAADARTALAILARQGETIDCVISDIVMVPESGLELARLIRTGQAGVRRDLPIVLLTGMAESAFVRAAVELDVNGFVVKPISATGLAARLSQVFARPIRLKPVANYCTVPVAVEPTQPPPSSPLNRAT